MTVRQPPDDRSKVRERRLAEALRANLRRRKTAARARPAAAAEADTTPKPGDSSGQSGPSGGRP